MGLKKYQAQTIDLVNHQIDGEKATKEEIASTFFSIKKNVKTRDYPITGPILNLKENFENNEDKTNKEN